VAALAVELVGLLEPMSEEASVEDSLEQLVLEEAREVTFVFAIHRHKQTHCRQTPTLVETLFRMPLPFHHQIERRREILQH
jgi:hypothetical protein